MVYSSSGQAHVTLPSPPPRRPPSLPACLPPSLPLCPQSGRPDIGHPLSLVASLALVGAMAPRFAKTKKARGRGRIAGMQVARAGACVLKRVLRHQRTTCPALPSSPVCWRAAVARGRDERDGRAVCGMPGGGDAGVVEHPKAPARRLITRMHVPGLMMGCWVHSNTPPRTTFHRCWPKPESHLGLVRAAHGLLTGRNNRLARPGIEPGTYRSDVTFVSVNGAHNLLK